MKERSKVSGQLTALCDDKSCYHDLRVLTISYLLTGDVGTKLYIGNLNFDTTADTLKAAFEAYGEVKDCFVPVDYDGNPRGFAFISMDEENALNAIEGLNGQELDGRTLNVNKSLPKGEKKKPQRNYNTARYQ